ncbi:hypothetical protein MM213_07215 [Belliella sp. R4-6]|uniref:Uncharacterized protein n=1 Tax=Belliella alkalica TaxID=1730871 RepID=A0ABS9VA14_9BACT|nr:hypothetical protein [Belliella alkalica]MCH7413266.1 hypothetical protein [Belliella alkalica]
MTNISNILLSLLVSLISLGSFISEDCSGNNEKIILIVNKDSKRIDVYDRNGSTSVWVSFGSPNLRANLFHIPPEVNHWEYSHEKVEVGHLDLAKSQVLFAENLDFMDWGDLEQLGKKQKIYMILYEDYMSKERFVWNKKFTAYEVWVTADGPI